MSINTFAAVVGDNDGAAFITKAEFDSLKNDFQSQLDRYNSSIDNKIDGAIASYLAGMNVNKKEQRQALATIFAPSVVMANQNFLAANCYYKYGFVNFTGIHRAIRWSATSGVHSAGLYKAPATQVTPFAYNVIQSNGDGKWEWLGWNDNIMIKLDCETVCIDDNRTTAGGQLTLCGFKFQGNGTYADLNFDMIRAGQGGTSGNDNVVESGYQDPVLNANFASVSYGNDWKFTNMFILDSGDYAGQFHEINDTLTWTNDPSLTEGRSSWLNKLEFTSVQYRDSYGNTHPVIKPMAHNTGIDTTYGAPAFGFSTNVTKWANLYLSKNNGMDLKLTDGLPLVKLEKDDKKISWVMSFDDAASSYKLYASLGAFPQDLNDAVLVPLKIEVGGVEVSYLNPVIASGTKVTFDNETYRSDKELYLKWEKTSKASSDDNDGILLIDSNMSVTVEK